jgi:hypothetical protein
MVLHWADWCWSAGGITDQAVERNCGRLILLRTVCRDSVGTEHCAGSLMSGKIKLRATWATARPWPQIGIKVERTWSAEERDKRKVLIYMCRIG